MTIYYIYAYIRPNGTPYYIGKGKGNRALSEHRVSVPKERSKIVIMESGLTEIGALALERRYIRWYGRKDLGTGILRNLTDGGDGTNPSAKTRKKIADANKKRVWSETARKKVSVSSKGNKYAAGQKIKHLYEFICQNCNKSEMRRSTTHNKRTKFCSRSCVRCYQIKNQSDEIKKIISDKISKKMKGNIHNLGKKRSEEYKKQQSKSMMGSNNPFYGKTHNQETINKIRESNKRRKKTN
jgi:hypothetical protein